MDSPSPAKNPSRPPPDLLDLHDNVLDDIFTRIGIRDAVRTSTLSRAWRNRWQSMPVLGLSGLSPAAIDNVLLFHSAPVKGFTIISASSVPTDRWLVPLSRTSSKTLSSLHLCFTNQPLRPIHSLVFSFRSLDNLSFTQCSISPPPSFPGFPLLRMLVLCDIVLPSALHLSALISRCPLLEDLTLTSVRPCGRLRILNPKLRDFSFTGECDGISFAGGQTLETVSIFMHDVEMDIGVAELFSGDAVCRDVLDLLYLDMEIMAKPRLHIPESIPTSFQQLTVLKLCLKWTNTRHISAMLCLIRSVPNLQKLYTRGINFTTDHAYGGYELELGEEFWCQQIVGELANLRLVEMIDVIFTLPEIGFMKFILARAPVLELLMTVSATRSHWIDFGIIKYLTEYHRASPQAGIIYAEHEVADEEAEAEDEVAEEEEEEEEVAEEEN